MVFETITVAEQPHCVTVTLTRPDVRNAIDARMAAELDAVCRDIEARPRMLVLTGAGRTFASGADLTQLRDRGRDDALRGINSRVFDRIAKLPLPTVAVVNGPAVGGGAELAYACDFRVAADTARFSNPEVSLGIMAAAGASWRLRDLVGVTIAREMLLTGRVVRADEALACGLVSRVAAPDALTECAAEFLALMAGAVPLALQLTKIALAGPRDAHPELDELAQAVLFETAEKRTRISAFLDRDMTGLGADG